ncbi:tetratricopeptide repeat protein [Serinicoccus sp. CNJ-927]|uniref:tetratricopeptide repeat protein n=1 Tax=Serinicoccus sp. CNJ-927 TaxID=1904970 RepID=UPI000B15C711|nr:tetratricopeptide repeat protein [Serinicoccus sp. CNJ-927]
MDPMPGRKLLGPEPEDFVRQGGALPAFGWWTFGCERLRTGANMDVVAAAYPQLEAHLQGMARAKLKATGAFDRLGGRAKQVARALSVDVAGEGIDLLADVAGFVPGASLVVKYSGRGIGQARQSLKNRAELAETTDMGTRVEQARTSAAQELADTIRDLSHPGLPQVVVVEDLHRMGPDLAELLDALARPVASQPVVVVGTAWPEGAHNSEYRRWVDRATAAGHLDELPVVPLVESDLVQLVLQHAPQTDDHTAQMLAKRMPNPHFIKLWLTSGQVKRSIAETQGRIELDPGELDRLPTSVRDVVRMRWDELPAPVKSALIRAISSRATNPSQSDADGAIPTYDIATVAHATELARIGQDDLADCLRHAVKPLSWCFDQDDIHWVREHMLLDTVREFIEDQDLGLSKMEIAQLHDATRQVLAEAITERANGQSAMPGTPHNLALAQWFLDLTRPNETVSDAVQVAAYTIALQLAAIYRYREAISLMRDWFPGLPDAPLDTRHAVAYWLGEDGRVKDAITEFEVLLEDRTRVLGPEAPATLITRNNLAYWLGEDGRVKDAIAQSEQLLENRTRVLGPEAPDTLNTRNNLAYWLGEDGRVKDAITEFEVLLEDFIRVLGPEAPDTLITRNNLAYWLGEDGRVKDAIAQFEVLLEDRTRVLGPEAPATLITRNNLASWLGEDGRVKDAITQFEQLLENRTRVLGPEAPATLNTRNNLASWLGRDGRVKDAITEFEVLLEDRTRVLGPEAPDTLTTWGNLASWLGRDGRVKDAITQFEQLLEDRTRVLGPEAPDTLITRGNLASWLGEDGRVKDAIREFEVLLEDFIRVLGPEAPDTLITRGNLASWLGRDGRVKDAIREFEVLLEDFIRVLGLEAPATLITRGNLAYWLGEDGRVKDAIREFEVLLEDFVRVLGPDAPDTLITRGNLASLLGEDGRVKDAITEFEVLLEDFIRVLGPDAPDTLTTWGKLAYWLGEDGRVKDAIAQLERLLDDATRVFGTEHPFTGAVRGRLHRLRGDRADG